MKHEGAVEKNDQKFVTDMIKDIKYHGFCYVKNNILAKKITDLDPKIKIRYSENESAYIATFDLATHYNQSKPRSKRERL